MNERLTPSESYTYITKNGKEISIQIYNSVDEIPQVIYEQIVDLILLGGAVERSGLESRLRNVVRFQLAFDKKKLIGILALKRPLKVYKRMIAKKARLKGRELEEFNKVEYEAGYLVVHPLYRGMGIADRLNFYLPDIKIFATTKSLKVEKIIKKYGFKQIGSPYPSSIDGEYIKLFIRKKKGGKEINNLEHLKGEKRKLKKELEILKRKRNNLSERDYEKEYNKIIDKLVDIEDKLIQIKLKEKKLKRGDNVNEELYLRVEKGRKGDGTKGYVRMNKKNRDLIGVELGEYVEIEKNGSTVKAIVRRSDREYIGRDIIQIPKRFREKIGVEVGDIVVTRRYGRAPMKVEETYEEPIRRYEPQIREELQREVNTPTGVKILCGLMILSAIFLILGGIWLMFPLASVLGVLYFPLVYGLWTLKTWAWYGTMILLVISLISNVFMLNIPAAGLGVILLLYLFTKKEIYNV